MFKDAFQDNSEMDFATQVKDELVCVNRVSNIEGKLKLAHLRVIIILIQHLQPALRHKITFRRISGSVPERLLPPKSEITLDGCRRIINIPVSEFCFGKRNGGRLRKYLEELQHCHICVSLKGESISVGDGQCQAFGECEVAVFGCEQRLNYKFTDMYLYRS